MILLYLCTFLLYVFGLLNLFGLSKEYFYKQLLFTLVGLLVFYIVRRVNIDFFRLNSKLLYWVFIAIMLMTYIIGFEAKGSRRWIDLGFFNFQPSEFFKVFFILFIADYFSRFRSAIALLPHYAKSILYFALPSFIIFKQPDLATTVIFTFIFAVLCFFSKIPKKYFLYTVLIGILILPLGTFFLKDYQKHRITSFLSPHLNQQSTSYNMTQAVISIGSGGFIGRGLGLGTQSQLYFLPENHTDFAFSALVEQFGFIGGAIIIILFSIIALVLIKKLVDFYYKKDEDGLFKFYFVLGFLAFFIFQIFINIGMNLGMLPIAGIALPLVSYGGSSLITWMIGLGLLSRIIK
ncbi:MAG: FtsW/RodA/SpoVE family cell cycle protein [Patescibacteria group bacterium]